jgi:hypothetical protein
VGYDILWELDSENSVEPDGDCVGARSASQDTGHLHMDIRLSDKRRGGPEGDGRLVTGQSGEGRLQKWGNHPDGICGLCNHSREMGLKLLGGRPTRGTTGHLQSSVCRLESPATTGDHRTT